MKLYIRSLKALLGRNTVKVIAYLVGRRWVLRMEIGQVSAYKVAGDNDWTKCRSS